MSEQAQLTFPVLGMTCANCVAAVERNSKKVEGVTDASVNFASEKVTVTYDPALTDAKVVTANVIERVKMAGYLPSASGLYMSAYRIVPSLISAGTLISSLIDSCGNICVFLLS